MKIRAAVLEEFGQPLVVQEIDHVKGREADVFRALGATGIRASGFVLRQLLE